MTGLRCRLLGLYDKAEVGAGVAELPEERILGTVANHGDSPAAVEVFHFAGVVGELQEEDGVGLGFPDEEFVFDEFCIGRLRHGLHFLDKRGQLVYLVLYS